MDWISKMTNSSPRFADSQDANDDEPRLRLYTSFAYLDVYCACQPCAVDPYPPCRLSRSRTPYLQVLAFEGRISFQTALNAVQSLAPEDNHNRVFGAPDVQAGLLRLLSAGCGVLTRGRGCHMLNSGGAYSTPWRIRTCIKPL